MNTLKLTEKQVEIFNQLYNDVPVVRNLVNNYQDANDNEIMERIKTYEDACAALYREPISAEKFYELEIGDYEITFHKLKTIIEALNDENDICISDEEECYWYPRFAIDHKEVSLVFAGVDCNIANTSFIGISALALKNQALAEYCGKQFIKLWEGLIL